MTVSLLLSGFIYFWMITNYLTKLLEMIIIHLIIGIISTLLFLSIIRYSQKNQLIIAKWQWLLTIIEIAYIVFVLELIAGFIEEGSLKATLVMGSIFGFIAVIGAVLLGRFIFRIKKIPETREEKVEMPDDTVTTD